MPAYWNEAAPSQEAKKGNKAPFMVFSYHQEPSKRASRKCSIQFHLSAFGHFLFLAWRSSPHIHLTHSKRYSLFHTFSPIKLSALGWFPQKTRAQVRDSDAGILFEIDPRKQDWGGWWLKWRGKNQHKKPCQGPQCHLLRAVQQASQNHPPDGWKTGALLPYPPTPGPSPWWGLLRARSAYLSSPGSRCWDKGSSLSPVKSDTRKHLEERRKPTLGEKGPVKVC